MTGFDLPTALLSGFVGALLASYITHVFTFRRDEIKNMQQKIDDNTNAFSNICGLSVTFTRSYARFLRARANLDAHIQSERIGATIKDSWFLTLGTHASSTAIEYNRDLRDLWETIGVIAARLEKPQELVDLILTLGNTIRRGEETFAATGPDSLTTQEDIDNWLRERENSIVNFTDSELHQIMSNLLAYLETEIDNENAKLGQMQKDSGKIWKRLS